MYEKEKFPQKAPLCLSKSSSGERRWLPCCEIPTRWHGMRAPLSPGQGSWVTREPLSLFSSSKHDHMMLSRSTGRFTKCSFLKTRGLQHCDLLLSCYCHTTDTVEWGTPQFYWDWHKIHGDGLHWESSAEFCWNWSRI